LLVDSYFDSDETLQAIIADIPCTLDDLPQRATQLWLEDCLVDRIGRHFEGKQQAADYAIALAARILMHDPLGVLALARYTWMQPWSDHQLGNILLTDRGAIPEVNQRFIDLMDKYFHRDVARWGQGSSLTTAWYDYSVWWYRTLLVAPFVLLFWWLFTLRSLNPSSLIVSAAAIGSLLVVTATVTVSSMRFYHAIAWLSIIGFASIVDRLVRRLRRS
jgi:hypothetical protein